MQLPHFPIEISGRAALADEPLAVGEGEGRAQYILLANARAYRAGVRPGMRVSAAYALTRRLRVCARDIVAEEEALARLAAWCGQYTSWVSVVPPAALLLEVEGSRKIYGGLDRCIDDLREGISALGYTARLALAPTPLGAAWLAQTGREARIVDPARLANALAELPLTCLGLAPEQHALLNGLGLATLIDCWRLPRADLARRIGPPALDALDRALGRKPDPRPAFVPPARFRARLGLPAPVDTRTALLFPLRRLLLELAGFLSARGLGAAALEIGLHAARSMVTRVSLRLVLPSRDPPHLTSLVRERLERLTLTAPVEEVTLAANVLAPLAAQPRDFFAGAQTPAELQAQMLERLQARLGREAVRGLAVQADHRPEHAWRAVTPGTAGSASVTARRPLWLLPAPLALEVRDDRPYWEGKLALGAERERIESGWWDGTEVKRDYFIAYHRDGRRFWVFREGDRKQWFLQGIFG